MRTRDLSAERVAKNDATFRDANEGVKAAAERFNVTEGIPFVCECADEDCREIVQLSLSEYEAVRAHPRHFFNAPGHEAAAGPHGEVVAREPAYVVVEKVGIAGEVVERADPRRRQTDGQKPGR